jgi:hypothetical protein
MLGSNLSVDGNLTINGTGNLSPGSNTINLKGNWINRGTAGLTEATSTVNFIGTTLQTITSPGGDNFTNLTVNDSGPGIQLINDATIATTLNMAQGNIDLNGNNLILGLSVANKGTLARTTGTIFGTGSFKRWFNTTAIPGGSITGLFPVGTAANYRPFYVSAPVTAATTGGTITISYTDATTNTATSITDGTFTIATRKDLNWALSTANGLAGGLYNLRAEGTGFGKVNAVTDLRLMLSGSVVGTAGTNAGTTTNPQINRTGLSLANLSNTFYIGSIDAVNSPLPITLISFTATLENKYVRLDWETAAETNNDHFTIQRSTDRLGWKDVKVINGLIASSTEKSYTTLDENPFAGISYYRLEQTDIDGKQTYSVIRMINLNEDEKIKVYPNPATNFITIVSTTREKLNISFLNNNGERLKVPFSNGGNSSTLYVSGLATGIYYIQITRNNSIETRKIIIQGR